MHSSDHDGDSEGKMLCLVSEAPARYTYSRARDKISDEARYIQDGTK